MKKKNVDKKLLSNVIFNVIYNISIIVIPLITTPYIARVLGSYQTGLYSYTYTMVTWFAIFARFGFVNYGNRQVASIKSDQEQLNKTFSSILGIQALTGSLAIAGYAIYLVFFCKDYFFLSLLSGFHLLGAALDIVWLFYGLEEFKFITIKTMSVRIIATICIFIFVNTQQDTWKYVFILAMITFVNSLLLWMNIRGKVKIVRITFSDIAVHLKGCAILFVPVVLIDIYRLMDKVMLGQIGAIQEIGYYTYADRIAELPYSVITAVGAVMLPHMTHMVAMGEKKKAFRMIRGTFELNTIVGSAIMFGLIAVSDSFVLHFLGEGYYRTAMLVRIISPMIIVRAWANVIRTQYLMPNRMDMAYVTSLVAGVIINLILNSLFIPKHGAVGAAVATLCAESVVAIIQIWFGRKELNVVGLVIQNVPYLVAGGVMMVALIFLPFPKSNSLLVLALKVLTGAVIYICICAGILLVKRRTNKHS